MNAPSPAFRAAFDAGADWNADTTCRVGHDDAVQQAWDAHSPGPRPSAEFPAVERCASCEHDQSHHASDDGACWYTVTSARVDVPAGCACRGFIASAPVGPRPSAEFPAVDPACDLPAAVEVLRRDAPTRHPYDALLYGMTADVLEAITPAAPGLVLDLASEIDARAGEADSPAATIGVPVLRRWALSARFLASRADTHEQHCHDVLALLGMENGDVVDAVRARTTTPGGFDPGSLAAHLTRCAALVHDRGTRLDQSELMIVRAAGDAAARALTTTPGDDRGHEPLVERLEQLEALPDGAILRGGPQRLVMEKIGDAWWAVGNSRQVTAADFLPAVRMDAFASITASPTVTREAVIGDKVEMTVTLPAASRWADTDEDSSVPAWDIDAIHGGAAVTAWNEGVEIDGALDEGPRVDLIERDALRILAAVHAHRQFAARLTEENRHA